MNPIFVIALTALFVAMAVATVSRYYSSKRKIRKFKIKLSGKKHYSEVNVVFRYGKNEKVKKMKIKMCNYKNDLKKECNIYY